MDTYILTKNILLFINRHRPNLIMRYPEPVET